MGGERPIHPVSQFCPSWGIEWFRVMYLSGQMGSFGGIHLLAHETVSGEFCFFMWHSALRRPSRPPCYCLAGGLCQCYSALPALAFTGDSGWYRYTPSVFARHCVLAVLWYPVPSLPVKARTGLTAWHTWQTKSALPSGADCQRGDGGIWWNGWGHGFCPLCWKGEEHVDDEE